MSPTPTSNSGLAPNVASALCYVLTIVSGVIFLVLDPYKNDRQIRFNAFQSIFFGLSSIALSIVLTIVSIVCAMILPASLMLLFSLVSMFVWLGYLAVWVYLIIRAYQGNPLELPVIGPIARQQAG